ncbi:Aste57867_12631 [Aphanomyces stellatus]|uniref:Aste57867_12631 protein n=1 Tax=Aphanomyces stellatus TaxID=120398 RepID=A0A485KWI3_9STRA|nr:hypothetical protein As57867_012585 [Aphanomyces stellatus]VFT89481.1 Aste57867_12631 [Aphanomyces stellatus]
MREETFLRRLQAGVHEVFERQLLTDVTLRVGTKLIPAHRLVLALHSPYFRAMFTTGMRECSMDEIHLEHADPHAFDVILQYMYSGRDIDLGHCNIWPLLDACDRLQIEVLVDACCAKMANELSVDNCLDIFACADAFQQRGQCAMLRGLALIYATTFFTAIVTTDAFFELPMHLVHAFLSSDMLCVVDDAHVFAALLAWVDFDVPTRQLHLRSLLSCVRARAIRRPLDVLLTHTAALLQEPIDHIARHFHEAVPPLPPPRPSTIPLLIALGGSNGRVVLNSTECFDMVRHCWVSFPPMLARRAYHGSVTVLNHIFVLGGYWTRRERRACLHLSTVEMLNPATRQWQYVAPMLHARSYLGVVHLDGYIYAIGGFNGMRHFDCVERFSLAKGTWEHVAPMRRRRSGLSAVVAHGRIFAMGGFDGETHLHSVETYDPTTGEWTLLPTAMADPRNGAAAVVLSNDYLYIFGGEVEHGERLSSGEMYHVPTTTWGSSPTLPVCLSGHGAVVWQEEFIFCFGGSTTAEGHMNTVYRFDGVTQSWAPVSPMRSVRSGMAIATLAARPIDISDPAFAGSVVSK